MKHFEEKLKKDKAQLYEQNAELKKNMADLRSVNIYLIVIIEEKEYALKSLNDSLLQEAKINKTQGKTIANQGKEIIALEG